MEPGIRAAIKLLLRRTLVQNIFVRQIIFYSTYSGKVLKNDTGSFETIIF